MLTLLAGSAWLGLVAWLLRRALRQRRIHTAAPATPPPEFRLPPLSVIIPARNEAANIGPCLASLAAQSGTDDAYRIIVVDDDLQDRTADAVRQAAGSRPAVTLLDAGPLPAGWMGKPHACWCGALASEAGWLCFMDADARAAPQLLAAAVHAAEQRGADMLSLLPRHELGSFWERLIIPTGLLMVACARDMAAPAHRPAPDLTVNGQFILIRRDVYLAVGGHAAVRGEICEDRALARRVVAHGFRFAALPGEHLLRARLYSDLPSLWHGFAKNAVEIMGSAGRTLAVAAAAVAIAWMVPLLPLGAAVATWRYPGWAAGLGLLSALSGSGIVLGVLLGTARYFGVPRGYGLLFPLGAGMAAAIAWHGALPGARTRIRWKGRLCQPNRTAPGAAVLTEWL